MSFCKNCGKELDEGAKFCPNCGAKSENESSFSQNGTPLEENKEWFKLEDITYSFTPEDIAASSKLSFFSYLGILFVVPLLASSNSKFAKFHANQGCVIFILNIALNFLKTILATALTLTGAGLFIKPLSLLFGALSLALFVISIMGIVYSLKGKAVKFPIIGSLTIFK